MKLPPKIAATIATSREKGQLAGRRFRRRVLVTVRRLFVIDEDHIRDQALDQLRTDLNKLATLLGQKVTQDQKELLITRDLQDRLEWHELKGPLKESKAALDRRRNKGLVLLGDPNKNGH